MHPRGQECTPVGGEKSSFYWAEEGAAFNLGVFHRVRKMTKKVVSISGNNGSGPHAAKILARPMEEIMGKQCLEQLN